MDYDRTVLAYHGCDKDLAEKLLAGEPWKKSENDYDWLGHGVYFWEFGSDRALRFAREQQRRGKVKTPVVIGAVLQLGNCFDLMDTRFTQDLAQAYERWKELLEEKGVPLPKNTGKTPDKKLRRRDCAVLNWYLKQAAALGETYDTVRCGFVEGDPVYEGSGIYQESHIQIAVRTLGCIVGVFRPTRRTT